MSILRYHEQEFYCKQSPKLEFTMVSSCSSTENFTRCATCNPTSSRSCLSFSPTNARSSSRVQRSLKESRRCRHVFGADCGTNAALVRLWRPRNRRRKRIAALESVSGGDGRAHRGTTHTGPAQPSRSPRQYWGHRCHGAEDVLLAGEGGRPRNRAARRSVSRADPSIFRFLLAITCAI
jgi:hypothetical protein